MWNLLHGDVGYSFYNSTSVRSLIWERVPVTFSLAIGAAVLWLVIGISSGVLAATRPRSVADRVVTVTSLFFYSMPAFLLGLIFLYFLFFRLHLAGIAIFPGSGYVPLTEDPLAWAQHLILPWLTIALVTAALYSRLTRGSMLDVLGEDYIRTARAKGLRERRVVYRHGLRSAVTPVVTQFGIDLGTLLGGVIIVEIHLRAPGARSTRGAVGDDAGSAGHHRHRGGGGGVHRRRQHPRRHLLRAPRPAGQSALSEPQDLPHRRFRFGARIDDVEQRLGREARSSAGRSGRSAARGRGSSGKESSRRWSSRAWTTSSFACRISCRKPVARKTRGLDQPLERRTDAGDMPRVRGSRGARPG